ncbi:MAG TPA: putative porin [Opitutaceae bacterium]|nr:putative porin [Opitutaceae bacterium]
MNNDHHETTFPASRAWRVLSLALGWAATTCAVLAAPAVTRSESVTINLINRMVDRGLLSRDDAIDLLQQAENDAASARAEAAATQAALARLEAAQGSPAIAANSPASPTARAETASSASRAATPAPAATDQDVVRVTYVPEVVKRQIRDDVTQEILAQQRAEHWSTPRALPDWVTRYTLFGDVRLREEALFFPAGNNNTGAFPNFNAINSGAPFDVTGTLFSPQNNVDRDRNRLRVRTRLGADIDLEDNFSTGVRIATGESKSPVSTNQSLGASGGNFTKYSLWLDRAFVRYNWLLDENDSVQFLGGRFDNPFLATSMIFDDDLGFDGLAAQAILNGKIGRTQQKITLGAFPLFSSALDFATNQPAKFKSQDKWLLGAQVAHFWGDPGVVAVNVAASYYYFYNVEGRKSSPFVPVTSADNGDTDETRPSFAQTGNTYFPLRDITPSPLNNFGTTNQWQYFGLAAPFRELVLTSKIDFNKYAPSVQTSLTAEWVKNLAFHRRRIAREAVNNLGPGGLGDFVGGDTGWNLELKIGRAAIAAPRDWNVTLGYRYLETDATLDGLTDSDFGNGGTNLKGFTLGGSFALTRNVWLTARWLSATSIAGPTYKNDTLQFDFNGKF